MKKEKEQKPYRVIAAYDTETNNLGGLEGFRAFPVVHQIGIFPGTPDKLKNITNDNVRAQIVVIIERHTEKAYSWFDHLIIKGKAEGFVPVVMVHNLGFDMYSLSDYLNRYEVRPLAKSSTKPITFNVLGDDGEPVLCFWDTLGFYGKSLSQMGNECRFPKLVGSWDYALQRTPETPLTDEELEYCRHDIYVMFAYLGYFLRHNPLIDPEKLACKVMTKTGVVRAKRSALFGNVRKGRGNPTVGSFWRFLNVDNLPQSDDELFTMHICTRGGFTFCARNHASRPYDLEGTPLVVAGYDAVSQHPAQMVSHFYPHSFMPVTPEKLDKDASIIGNIGLDYVLSHWARPFPVAFNACFSFTNLRLKAGSLWESEGISPLAWARTRSISYANNEDNQTGSDFKNAMDGMGYTDYASGETHAFGKLESAESCLLWLTELEFWNVCQCFEWTECHAVSGYDTLRFCRPSDMTALSVMHFYQAKNIVKKYKHLHDSRQPLGDISELLEYIPSSLADSMKAGTALDVDVVNYYQTTKADLNALFGIEATNEAKLDLILTADGIKSSGVPGLDNLPNNPKAFYQLGQRVVGWSRIAQVITMTLAWPHAEGIINGDTDSVKFLAQEHSLPAIDRALDRLARAIDRGRHIVCSRIRNSYPDKCHDLSRIGHYEREFTVKRFCASWNKAYCVQEYDKRYEEMRFSFTLAGVSSTSGDHCLNRYADWLYHHGWSFSDVASLILGYNVTIDDTVTKANGRKAPRWGEWFEGKVTDYLGKAAHVSEPAALALFPMSKTIGDETKEDNLLNMQFAKINNSQVNTDPVILEWGGDEPLIIRLGKEF